MTEENARTEDFDTSPPAEEIESVSEEQRFTERFDEIMDGFGQACENGKIQLAVAVALDPSLPQPLVFLRGHRYDCAKLMALVLKNIKDDLNSQLQTDTLFVK